MSLGDAIKSGHDEYRRLFSKMFKTTERDATERQRLFLDYKLKLFAHHEAEAIHLIPAMLKVPDLVDMAYEIMEEHAAMKKLIGDLEKFGYDKKMWRYALSPLYSIMRVHWEKEEDYLIPFAPNYFSAAQMEEMGKKFEEEVVTYITKHSSR